MAAWLRDDDLRVGLGCMRLSTEADRDPERAAATIGAALEAGITIFDSAHAYALDEDDAGHNERLLGEVIRAKAATARARVVTKGGMRRPGGRWEPDGRAKSIREGCEASLAALGGVPIDLFLLHVPDPAVPFATSVRALAQLVEKKLVAHVGLSNVTRAQLDEALGLAPISAVELSLGWHDDAALRGGVVARCVERGISVLAHRPLGGVTRAKRLKRDVLAKAIAGKHGCSPAAAALACVLDLHPRVVALPGASRPETARDAATAARVTLDEADRELVRERLDRRMVHPPKPPAAFVEGEVVLLMGLQGSGKTDAVAAYEARGYERLSRDARGGSMAQLHKALDERLAAGARRIVLDNTYVVRASRREAIEVAWKHRVPVRGIWIDIALADAQVNVILRMLRAHGRLLTPVEMTKKPIGPESIGPMAQHRMLRVLERPQEDEGFTPLEIVPFTRRPGEERGAAGAIASLDALARRESLERLVALARPVIAFGWMTQDGGAKTLAAAREAGLTVHFAECRHPAGPLVCWCRPPLPGLVLELAERHAIDPRDSDFFGTSPAHRAMASALGARWRGPDD